MSYALTVIHPPVPPAAFGKAVVLDPVATKGALQRQIEYVLMTEAGSDKFGAMAFGLTIITADPGWVIQHESGMSFRVDPADNAPHPCPCCGRLVLPGDHALADHDDVLCVGCFTWNIVPVGCLPANTAHTEEP